MVSIITTSELQKNIGQISGTINKKSFIVTSHGKGKMVLLPYFDGCDEQIQSYISDYGKTLVYKKSEVVDLIKEVLPRFGVVKASIFGSFAKGTATENSDIDLLVEFESGKSLFDLIELKQVLEDKLRIKVDVNTYNAINASLKDEIINSQEIIYER